MAFVSWMLLLLFNVCIWRCRVAMSSDVAVPKSDFAIFPTKSKSPRFDLDVQIYRLAAGSSVV